MSPRAGLSMAVILQEALDLADQHGLEGLTLSALAEALGVRTPSLYNYVDGLPGLRRALALHGTQELNLRLAHAALGKSGSQAVMALAEAYRNFILDHPGRYSATVQSALLTDPAEPELFAATQDGITIVLAALSAYQLEHSAAIHIVRSIRSLVHGYATLELAGGFGLPEEVDSSFTWGVDMLIAGIERHARGGER